MKTDDTSRKSDFVSELVLIEKEKVAGKVSEVFAYQGDRPYDGRVQVAALGSPQSRYTKLTFTCRKKDNYGNCGNTITITFDGEEVRPSAFAVYFDSNNSLDALKVLVETGVPEAACGHSITSWEAKGEDERAVTPAIVMDLAATEGRAWFVHSDRCDLRPGPNWIIAKGWLCRGKMGKIGVLVKAFTPESEVAMPKIEDENRARQFLRSLVSPQRPELSESLVFRIATALARRSQLKGHEIVRGTVADLLTIACPIWIKTPEGPRQLGETSAELGPTTSAKSQRVRATIDWLGAGKYVTGKQTVAGLTAGAEKMEGGQWFLKKGLLPRWDLSFIICDNMPPHYLDSQIESRRDGVVTVNSIVTAELWARVRLKLLSNPVAPFEETMYPCTLLKVYDSKMIARLTFAIYTYGSSPDQRYDPAILDPQPGDAELLDASRIVLRANLSRETTFTLPYALWPKVMQFSKKLELTYGCEDIPLLLRSVPYKIAVLSYSFALLEGYDSPDERHIMLSYQWLDYCARDIQLDKFVQSWRGQHDLSNQEYESLAAQIESEIDSDLKEHGGTREETYTAQLVNYLTKNTTAQRDELAGHLNVDKTTITRKVNLLKAGGLLRSDMQGYHFTAKGVRFFKRWLPEFDAFDASNASSLQARGGVQPEPVEGGPSPETGGIERIRRTNHAKSWTENPPLLRPHVPRGSSPDPADFRYSSDPTPNEARFVCDSEDCDFITTRSDEAQAHDHVTTLVHLDNRPGGVNDSSFDDADPSELGHRDEPGIVKQGASRIDLTLVEDFLIHTALPQQEARTGYGTEPTLAYSARSRFGDTAAQLVGGLLLDLKNRGIISDDRGRLRLVKK